jgi:hypothetical protein
VSSPAPQRENFRVSKRTLEKLIPRSVSVNAILRQSHRFRLAAQPGTIPFVETCAFVGTNPQNENTFVYCPSLGVP